MAVWKITEPASFFTEKTGLITHINHPQKNLQFLAGRYLLKLLAPSLDIHSLFITETGKPTDSTGSIHFSISHCMNLVAVCISSKSSVGIDIQFPEKKIEKLHTKFLSENDIKVLSVIPKPELIQLCFGWSVKETLFKWYGEGQVNFIDHLHIEMLQPIANEFDFQCRVLKNSERIIHVNGLMIDNHILTYTIS